MLIIYPQRKYIVFIYAGLDYISNGFCFFFIFENLQKPSLEPKARLKQLNGI